MSERKLHKFGSHKFGDLVSGPYDIKAIFVADGKSWRYPALGSAYPSFYSMWVMYVDLGDSLSRTPPGTLVEVWWWW